MHLYAVTGLLGNRASLFTRANMLSLVSLDDALLSLVLRLLHILHFEIQVWSFHAPGYCNSNFQIFLFFIFTTYFIVISETHINNSHIDHI